MSRHDKHQDHLTPLVVSRNTAARLLDSSTDLVDAMLARGELEKVQVGPRKVGVRYSSLVKLIGEAA